jgi:hypothetical protein
MFNFPLAANVNTLSLASWVNAAVRSRHAVPQIRNALDSIDMRQLGRDGFVRIGQIDVSSSCLKAAMSDRHQKWPDLTKSAHR